MFLKSDARKIFNQHENAVVVKAYVDGFFEPISQVNIEGTLKIFKKSEVNESGDYSIIDELAHYRSHGICNLDPIWIAYSADGDEVASGIIG